MGNVGRVPWKFLEESRFLARRVAKGGKVGRMLLLGPVEGGEGRGIVTGHGEGAGCGGRGGFLGDRRGDWVVGLLVDRNMRGGC